MIPRPKSAVARRATPRRQRIPRNPPVLANPCTFGTVLRFQKTASTAASVYYASLAKLIVASTSTIAGFCVYESIKVTKICMWSTVFVNTTSTSYSPPECVIRCDDEWMGQVSSSTSAVGKERTVRDTPTNTTGCALVLKHRGDTWYDVQSINSTFSATPRLYEIQGPLGAILDLHVVVKLANVARSSAATALATTGASAYRIYYNFLDSVNNVGATGTTVLPCINWANGPSTVNWV